MKYFVVFQNKTFKEERDRGILWAPTKDRSGGPPKFHWSSIKDCEVGDIVFSIVKNQIMSRGIVKEKAIVYGNPFKNDLWNHEGWLVKLEYYFLANEIMVRDYIEHFRPFLPDKYSPFNPVNGRGNQGYLFPIPQVLGREIDNLIIDTVIDIEIKDIYDLDEEDQELIKLVFEESGYAGGIPILLEEEPPSGSNKPKAKATIVKGKKRDYLKKAERDIKQGIKAEELVVNHEKHSLIQQGRSDLADQVKRVSRDADGYGYDVLSYDLEGNEKYIEVKSTSLGNRIPFDITANEVETSRVYKDRYWIYRVYHIEDEQPRFCKYQGQVEDNFIIEPSSYKAYF